MGKRSAPRYLEDEDKGGCCGCLCWCCCFLFLIVAVLAGMAAYFFFVYKPKAPSYSCLLYTSRCQALEESEKLGDIPLDVFVSVPVELRLGSIDLREVKVNMHCALILDSISPKKKLTIKSVTYQANVEF
ncbi:hypothetical protein BAE44_0008533 [Dichanthelium oligosanthes]|uniref:Late embryogenesis abundant protein LEA-2 subgroup domain-containing protein n=1 Tax=Dichanthelium oligosanthes TaxID=888268 RepID=A0A1E5VZA7_9POAL|nr:hypothetical protein BAE44_0008533 [Dichanthelium oligosanthes]